MRIYLDVSSLNRPFDDQGQVRIRLEADAITWILERMDEGDWTQVSSDMATIEVTAIQDPDRKARVRLLLPKSENVLTLTQATFERAAELQVVGFKPADAVHIAAAEEARADVFLSCDDRLCRLAHRQQRNVGVRVANPLDWLKEIGDAANAR